MEEHNESVQKIKQLRDSHHLKMSDWKYNDECNQYFEDFTYHMEEESS